MSFYSGNSGTATLPGAGTLFVTSWTADVEDELLPVTNKSSGGYKDYIYGNQGLTGTVEAVYNGAHPTRGSVGALTLNMPTGDSAGVITAAACRIGKIGYESSVDGVVTLKFDFTACGAFTIGGS